MPKSTVDRSSSRAPRSRGSTAISRRQLLAGAGTSAAALLLDRRGTEAQARTQATTARPIVFARTTVVTVDAVLDDVALAIEGDKIAAIGPTDTILKSHPDAEIYEG